MAPLLERSLQQARKAKRVWQRGRLALSYCTPGLAAAGRWLRDSQETTNFTYELTELNLQYLASFLAEVSGRSLQDAQAAIDELHGDDELRQHVQRKTAAAPAAIRATADPEARYARRVGWYALARLQKPRLVVETGVEKGLGACVLCAALRKNAAEGSPGRYLGTDINPDAGWLLDGPYAEHGRMLYGDSLESLRALEGPIDLFVNDSDHSLSYEAREYEAVAAKLSPAAVVLSDNAHMTPALWDFARATDRRFLFWAEWPDRHFYPGGGIGAAFAGRP